jgi:type VI secretion system protein ImpC
MSRISIGRFDHGGPGANEQQPFRILLMGDFSGRAGRGASDPDLASREPVQIDVDNYETALAELGTKILLPVGGAPTAGMEVREVEDFHPDRLVEKLEVFGSLRDLRRRLTDPATFAVAAAEVRSWAGAAPAGAAPPAATMPAAPPLSDAGLLEGLLGKRPSHVAGPAPAPAARQGVDNLLRSVVGPYVVPEAARDRQALTATVEQAMSAQLRAVLHHPAFQAVEAAWRAVHFLVTSLETDEDLTLHLVDVSLSELAEDLSGDLERSGLARLLVERPLRTQGGRPWAAVVGNYTFGRTLSEAALVARLAVIAKAAGAPLLAGAKDDMLGCESIAATPNPEDWTRAGEASAAAAWAQVRQMAEAKYVALGLPRFLLRLPYGAATEPIDSFRFEELDARSGHEAYLWGSAGFVLAQALGSSFTDRGWELSTELYRDVGNLPMHVTTEAANRRVMPCAEVYLSDRAGERIGQQGLTALLSVQGRDVVRLRGMMSLADPPAPVAGRWDE